MKRYLLSIILLFLVGILSAQINFEVESNKTQLSINETVTVQYTLSSTNQDDFEDLNNSINFPEFDDFDVIHNSFSRNESYINGKRSSNMSINLVLKPKREGKFRIEPAFINIKGKTYKTQELTLNVTYGKDDYVNSNPQKPMKEGYLAFEVSDKNPYINEGIVGSLVFYATNPVYLSRIRNAENPKFKGFSIENLKFDDQTISQKRMNGVLYYGRTLSKVLLTPIQSGQMEINPGKISVIVNNGFYGAKEESIMSSTVRMNVKSLPSNKPKNFTGSVGNFVVKTDTKPMKIKENESHTIDVILEGKGNLKLAKAPGIIVPNSIEKYKAVAKSNINGTEGNIINSNVIVPQKEGNYSIKTESFSFFNPTTERFETIPSQTIQVEVSKGDNSNNNTKIVDNQQDKESREDENKNSILDFSIFDDDNHEEDTTLAQQNTTSEDTGIFSKTSTWVGLGSVLSLAGLALFFVRRRKTQKEEVFVEIENEEILQQEEKIEFDFNPIKNAFYLLNQEELYSQIDQMLALIPKDQIENNTALQNAFLELKHFNQTEKYSPLSDVSSTSNLYQKAEQFHLNFLA